MFDYTVKVRHNKYKKRFKYLKINNTEHLMKIHTHFDVWTAIPSNQFIDGEF
jgi:hypothetical protein